MLTTADKDGRGGISKYGQSLKRGRVGVPGWLHISVGKKGQENMFFSRRIIRTLKKIFLSEFILLPEVPTISINAIPRRKIFFILQCSFEIFHNSRILVELVATKQNMKKVLLIS